MKTLACKAFGMDCDFVAKGKNDDEVISKMTDHVKTDHPDKLAGFKSMPKDKIVAMMEEE